MKFVLVFAGLSLTVNGLKQSDRKLRGTQAERKLPYSQRLNPPTLSWGADVESIATPAPTQWSGDSWGGLSTGGWGTDGWEGSWGGSWEGNVKIAGGSKSNKIMLNPGSLSGSAKSNKGYGINVSGVSIKSNKGYGINVAGGKSNKGSSGININSSKSSKGPGQPVNPIQPIDGWNNDGHVPVPVPVVRGKWSGDGHVTPLVTPNPTPYPTWKGDAHQTAKPTNKPVPSFNTPAPSICEERMLWHPNSDYTICTNDSDYEPDSEYVYESLQMCCMSVFGTLTCDFVDICQPEIKTPSPSESPITPAPTPCEAQVFFFDGETCSNEFYIADAPAYTNVMICCNINFGAGSFMSGGCNYVDVCNTLEPTPYPTPNPTRKPTENPTPNPTRKPTNAPIEPIVTPVPTDSPVTPAPTPCEAQVFFFDGNVCTNQFFVADGDAYNSLKACCNMNFGAGSFVNGECNYVDECNTLPPSPSPVTPEPTESPVTPAPTPCEAQVFFFDGETCSNEFFIADAPVYTNVTICCNMNFGPGSFTNGECNYVDECNTVPPTPSPTMIVTGSPTLAPITPAPTPCETIPFFFDGETCSNEFFIADAPLYTSAMICCNNSFGPGSFLNGSCGYIDICNTMPPSTKPTDSFVTPSPTPFPSPAQFIKTVSPTEKYIKTLPPTEDIITPLPTPEPTPVPSPLPSVESVTSLPTPVPSPFPIATDSPVTPAPTPCESLLFFFDGETCSNEFFIADTPSFDSALACCEANFGDGSLLDGSCNVIDECNTNPPTPSPSTAISTTSPSFGATPTVSKETTGPPTIYAGRGG